MSNATLSDFAEKASPPISIARRELRAKRFHDIRTKGGPPHRSPGAKMKLIATAGFTYQTRGQKLNGGRRELWRE